MKEKSIIFLVNDSSSGFPALSFLSLSLSLSFFFSFFLSLSSHCRFLRVPRRTEQCNRLTRYARRYTFFAPVPLNPARSHRRSATAAKPARASSSSNKHHHKPNRYTIRFMATAITFVWLLRIKVQYRHRETERERERVQEIFQRLGCSSSSFACL